MGFGDYPAEYNPKVHGPYDPGRYYGKPDTPLGEVKVGELTKWFTRRNWGPRAMVQAISRTYWRWNHKYILPKYGGVAPIVHVAVGSAFFFYLLNYYKIKKHRHFKYH